MPCPVKGILEINEDMVQILLRSVSGPVILSEHMDESKW